MILSMHISPTRIKSVSSFCATVPSILGKIAFGSEYCRSRDSAVGGYPKLSNSFLDCCLLWKNLLFYYINIDSTVIKKKKKKSIKAVDGNRKRRNKGQVPLLTI